MGKITCANVLSDIYATGVTEIDSLIMLLALSTQMTEQERDIVMPLIIKGFQDNAESAGLKVKFQNAVINPWCIIGGIATAVCTENEYINPLNTQAGDVLILTKPLGAQIACNAHSWLKNLDRLQKFLLFVSEEQIKIAFKLAVKSMVRLNRNAAVLMHKYGAHGATDVTGFGILGHANNLAHYQNNDIKFVIHTLPIIKDVLAIAEATGNKTKFLKGNTPETSGGLLISLSKNAATDYCNEIKGIDGWDAWVIGHVEIGNRTAEICENVNIIEVDMGIV